MILFALLLLFINTGLACSIITIPGVDVRLKGKGRSESTVDFSARTLEFNYDFPYYLGTTAKGTHFSADFPHCDPGTPWDAKYNYISVNMDLSCVNGKKESCMDQLFGDFEGQEVTWPFDGMNDQGLSISALLFTHARYTPKKMPENPIKVCNTEFPMYVLSKFATIEELVDHITQPNFVMMGPNGDRNGLPSHWNVQDATGRNIVIEYNNHNPGRASVYENGLGVMTNNPDFPWHSMNLNNYVNLQPEDHHFPKDMQATNYAWLEADGTPGKVPTPLGSGVNLLGIPGDVSPPSRFVRLFFMKQICMKAQKPVYQEGYPHSALTVVENLIQSVWIPRGIESVTKLPGLPFLHGYTQWTVIKVPKQLKYYYKGYADHRLKMIDLSKLTDADFQSKNRHNFIDFNNHIIDTSNMFMKPKAQIAESNLWSKDTAYSQQCSKVIHKGTAYQNMWYTMGDEPNADTATDYSAVWRLPTADNNYCNDNHAEMAQCDLESCYAPADKACKFEENGFKGWDKGEFCGESASTECREAVREWWFCYKTRCYPEDPNYGMAQAANENCNPADFYDDKCVVELYSEKTYCTGNNLRKIGLFSGTVEECAALVQEKCEWKHKFNYRSDLCQCTDQCPSEKNSGLGRLKIYTMKCPSSNAAPMKPAAPMKSSAPMKEKKKKHLYKKSDIRELREKFSALIKRLLKY